MQVIIQNVGIAGKLVYATPGAAGIDLCSANKESITIGKGGGRALISTGLKLAIPKGYEAQVRPRSGLALKHGITVLNSPGTIDSDYRGEVGVILLNTDPEKSFVVKHGDRIAQLVFSEVVKVTFKVEGGLLDETERGEGGFGSTDY